MKVTVFNGSPRGRKSNTHQIVEPLLAGASQAGAETEEVFLIEKNIGYCRGCFDCWSKTPGICVIKDDMAELMELFLDSDYVGLATPVYGMYMTGLLKTFTDRLLPLNTPAIHRHEDGTFYHRERYRSFPRQFFVANSGFPGEHNFELFRVLSQHQDLVLEVYRDCGEALQDEDGDNPQLAQNISRFRKALHQAGFEMVQAGRVSPETVQEIHLELIGAEEYTARVNQQLAGGTE